MNNEEVMNAVRQFLTLAFGLLTMRGIMTADQASTLITDFAVIVPAACSVGSVGWSIYAHWNMVKVPEKSVPPTPPQPRTGATPARAAAILLALGLASLLDGGSTLARAATKAKPTAAQAQANPILVLQQFTANDLQAAIADAQAQTPPDTLAIACYQALLPIVQSSATSPLPAGPGLFQAVQKARDAQALLANLQSTTGPLAAVNTACAPLVVQAQTTLVQLGILAGAVTAKVGLTLPLILPAIP